MTASPRTATRALLAGLAFAALSGVCRADGTGVEPTVSGTFGSQHYAGVDAAIAVSVPVTLPLLDRPADVRIDPTFSAFKSDASTATFRTGGLELGLQGRSLGVTMTGSVSPEADGYRNRAVGGDVSWQWPARADAPRGEAPVERTGPGPEPAAPVTPRRRWTFLADAGVNAIRHQDDFTVTTTTTTAKGKVRTRERGRSVVVNETDWTASLEASRVWFDWTGGVTASTYAQDLNHLGVRPALIAHLPGLHSTLQGFPDRHVDTKLSVVLPVVTPYVEYAHTSFELDQPSANAYTGGVVFDIGATEVDGSYERDAFAGGKAADESFTTLSLSYLF